MKSTKKCIVGLALLLGWSDLLWGCDQSCCPCPEHNAPLENTQAMKQATKHYDPFQQDQAKNQPPTLSTLNRLADDKRSPQGTVTLHGLVVTSEPFPIGKKGLRGRFVADSGFGPKSGAMLTWKSIADAPKYGYDPPKLAIGDVIDVTATYREFCGIPPTHYPHCSTQLELTPYRGKKGSLKPTGNRIPLPKPQEIRPEDVATANATAYEWKHRLVKVSNVSVMKPNIGYGRFRTTGGLVVDDTLYRYEKPAEDTHFASITGFLHVSFGEFKILPRNAGDLRPATVKETISSTTPGGKDDSVVMK